MSSYEEKGKGIFKHKAGNTKDIVEDTQEAIDKLTKAQQLNVVAMKKSFEFQQKLAKALSCLFTLGCMNITANRTVVRELKLKMSGASKSKLSALAREEFYNVIRQLKEQEDIIKKQEFLTSKVKENVSRLDDKDIVDEKQEAAISESKKNIESIESKLKDKDYLDKEQSKQISSIEKSLSKKDKIDAEQTKRLEEFQVLLNNKDNFDRKQEEALKENDDAIKLLFDYMKQKHIIDDAQQKEIESLKISLKSIKNIISITLSIVATLFSIISLLKVFSFF